MASKRTHDPETFQLRHTVYAVVTVPIRVAVV
jgi:hypothetical protein